MPSRTVLETLLEQDGIRLPESSAAEMRIPCFNPAHDDGAESLSIDVVRGSYRCHGCGIHGKADKYLTEFRGLGLAEAKDAFRAAGAAEEVVQSLMAAPAQADRRESLEPPSTDEPWMEAEVRRRLPPGHRTALYTYTDAAGKEVFKVGRYEATRDNSDEPIVRFYEFTPKPDGSGYWQVRPMSDQLEPEHRIPAYPIYRLPVIAEAVRSWEGKPGATKGEIWVVEGEKCADLVARTGRKRLVCSLYGGPRLALKQHHDLSIFDGQKVLLIADADKRGRDYMRKIGRRLVEHCAEVRFVLPPGENGYDIGDAAAGGFEEMMTFLRERSGGARSSDEVIGRPRRPSNG